MTDRALPDDAEIQGVLTNPPDIDCLLFVMAKWWDGWTLARIATDAGISRQRVGQILARVACTAKLRAATDRSRADSPRRTHPMHSNQARAALLHPLAYRLTPRQRAALAWQAQGLILVDIARRMGTSGHGARRLAVTGLMRLERIERNQQAKDAEKQAAQNTDPAMAVPPISREEIDALLGWNVSGSDAEAKETA